MNKSCLDYVNTINQIIDYPTLYLINYYDDIKTKVDIEFETKFKCISDIQVKEETTKQWKNLIDTIDSCLAKCMKNKIPNEVINEAKEFLEELNEASMQTHGFHCKLLSIQSKIESYLLLNDSHLVCLIEAQNRALIVEENFDREELECLLMLLAENKERYIVIPEVDFNRGVISNYTDKSDSIVMIGPFKKITSLSFNFESSITSEHLDRKYFKKLVNLKELFITLEKIKSLDFFQDLLNLETLYIENSNIGLYFQDEDLSRCLPKLTSLELSSCELSEFKLNSLIQLRELICFNSNITCLEANSFIGLVNLEKLDLSNNEMCLKHDCFNGLTNLKELTLISCNLKQLDKEVLNGLANLESLNLTNNYEMYFQDDFFKSLPKLKELYLSECDLSKFNENYFDELDGLEVLNLNFSIISLEKNFLNCLKSLKCLFLLKSGIQVLKRNTFDQLEKLEILDLSSNESIHLEEGCFNGLSKLKILELKNCNIASLKENAFIGLDSLEILDLNENSNILFEDGCFNGLVNIIEIKK